MTQEQSDKYEILLNRLNDMFISDVLSFLTIDVVLDNNITIDGLFFDDWSVRLKKGKEVLNNVPLDVFSIDVIDDVISGFDKKCDEIEKSRNRFNDSQYCGSL